MMMTEMNTHKKDVIDVLVVLLVVLLGAARSYIHVALVVLKLAEHRQLRRGVGKQRRILVSYLPNYRQES